jgi:hypothetical protein
MVPGTIVTLIWTQAKFRGEYRVDVRAATGTGDGLGPAVESSMAERAWGGQYLRGDDRNAEHTAM